MRRIESTFAVLAGLMFVACASGDGKNNLWPDLDRKQSLYVDRDHNDIRHALPLLSGQYRDNAELIAQFPVAAWFTRGAPEQIRRDVAALVSKAQARNQLPVLVPYYLPFRDCQQYSAGGAANTQEYKAWIDAFASGIGAHRAMVILEPDSLGIIPHFINLAGEKEWCQPKELDPVDAAAARFEQLNYAVSAFARLPNVRVYLDGTHSRWLSVGDAARRLLHAGVERAAGFYLNVSNYYPTDELIRYGVAVSQCIQGAIKIAEPHRADYFKRCPAAPIADVNLKDHPHFVIDTSRNGRGPWTPPANKYADPQSWCNPPKRGLGDRPTLNTSHPLLDGKLWIKVPGESDGECLRGTQGPHDPERGMIAPPAGKWFKEQAAELIEFAVPPVRR